jgi:hypothetical protein
MISLFSKDVTFSINGVDLVLTGRDYLFQLASGSCYSGFVGDDVLLPGISLILITKIN